MITITGTARIFLCNIPIDLRKGFDGLCGLVQIIFNEEPTTGAYFVFLNKAKNMMKVLYWDGDGFAIWHKRLEKGSFRTNETQKIQLERKEFFMLLEGIKPMRLQRRFSLQ